MVFWRKKKENGHKSGKSNNRLSNLFNMLARADETYKNIPPHIRLEVEKISQGLNEFGPRKLRRRGMGTEFYESRDFRPGTDERKQINARLSARAGRPIVVEKEAEIRQHFYLWRDATESMDYASANAPYTKKEAAEIMLLAFARHVSDNEEQVGILGRGGTYRGGKAVDRLAGQLADVNIITGDMPVINRKLPRHSTVVLFGDFLDTDALKAGLGSLNGAELKGFLVMTLDPGELDFDFKGHVEFEGMEGEGSERFKKAEAMKSAYQQQIQNHIREVGQIAKSKGFQLIVQRTDKPLYKALLGIYGLTPSAPAQAIERPSSPGQPGQ